MLVIIQENEHHFQVGFTQCSDFSPTKDMLKPKEKRDMGLPPDIPSLGEVQNNMDIRPPRWKDVQAVVRRAKASSTLGSNGVPYWVNKGTSSGLRFR